MRQQGVFADVPVFYESNVVLVKKSSKAHTLKALSTSKFAVLQGSSQQASGQVIFPKASFKAFATETDAATEVVVGRSDAAIYSEFSAGSILDKNKTLRTLGGPPLFVDANTYFMPQGDEKRVQREYAADDRRDEPAAALRRETVADRHKRAQRRQPADEREHDNDHQAARPVGPPTVTRAVAGRPVSRAPHLLP